MITVRGLIFKIKNLFRKPAPAPAKAPAPTLHDLHKQLATASDAYRGLIETGITNLEIAAAKQEVLRNRALDKVTSYAELAANAKGAATVAQNQLADIRSVLEGNK